MSVQPVFQNNVFLSIIFLVGGGGGGGSGMYSRDIDFLEATM